MTDYAAPLSGLCLAAILAALAWRDWREMILPDELNALLAACGLAQSYVTGQPPLAEGIAAAALAGGLLYAVAWGFRRWRGIDGLGLGDVKLAAAGGPWIGLEGIGPMLLAATATAGLALAWRASREPGFDAGARFAFGPYLALGVAVAWGLGR